MKNKYIITTGGGLGNQILQYALYLYLSKHGYNVYFYIKKNDIVRSFRLANINSSNKLVCFIAQRYAFFQMILKIGSLIVGKKCGKNSLLGYSIVDFPQWKHYRFVYEILPLLRLSLKFPENNDLRNEKLKSIMMDTESVSIHVRRGDYQNSSYWRVILGDICDKDYYNDAISKARSIFRSPRFFVFSDDVEWVRKNLNVVDAIYVDWNIGKDSFRDMELMTYCKANIIANSTFSLCASLLNVNASPIRIGPLKWVNSDKDDLKDKYLNQDWIVINNKKPQISILCSITLSTSDIQNIRKQTFTDFEVIYSRCLEEDERFHVGPAKGNHIFICEVDNLKLFRDRNILKKWLKEKYENENIL